LGNLLPINLQINFNLSKRVFFFSFLKMCYEENFGREVICFVNTEQVKFNNINNRNLIKLIFGSHETSWKYLCTNSFFIYCMQTTIRITLCIFFSLQLIHLELSQPISLCYVLFDFN